MDLGRRFLICAALLAMALPGLAQRPAHYDQANADLVNAMDLYSKAKYGAAAYELERVVERIKDPHDGNRVHAEYHRAMCSVRLFNNDAAHRLQTFINEHPESQFVPAVRFELFKYAFAKKKWKDVISWSEKVDRFSLDPEDLEEYRFKRGYSFFQEDDRDKVLGEFVEIQDGTGTYAAPALYYASHIHYERGNYVSALAGFQKLEKDENFGRIVPYYIAEILFLQGK